MIEAYIRRIGSKVCITLPDQRFVMVEESELTKKELEVVNSGGGYCQVTQLLSLVAM